MKWSAPGHGARFSQQLHHHKWGSVKPSELLTVAPQWDLSHNSSAKFLDWIWTSENRNLQGSAKKFLSLRTPPADLSQNYSGSLQLDTWVSQDQAASYVYLWTVPSWQYRTLECLPPSFPVPLPLSPHSCCSEMSNQPSRPLKVLKSEHFLQSLFSTKSQWRLNEQLDRWPLQYIH